MSDRPTRCAYSLDGSLWTQFPKGPKFDIGFGIEEQNINLETDRGRRFIYPQFTRDKWDISFRFTDDERSEFQAFHDAVDGQLNPFYLTVGADGIALMLMYGRKTSGFLPGGISVAAVPVVYEYRFSIIGTVADLTTEDFVLPGPFAGISFAGLW